ncbi:MAG: metallophosphoesterase [Oscillospiraceae bacterium]|nr:metallophosphoesterase [Oscillospiraceae bacterium]
MRIIVMSDSHGQSSQVERIIRANPEADMFIHLGDGESEIAQMKIKYPDIDLRSVRGNCDWSKDSPDFLVVDCGTAKIFCCHGHRYSVKSGTELLRSIARDNGCAAAFFGHTHERYIAREDGIEILNPGSCSSPRDGNKPSYAFVDVLENGIFLNIIDVGY